MLEAHPLPSYIPRKHHTAWACIHARSRHTQNTHVSPYHLFLAGWETLKPCGLESPPSSTPGILLQSIQQESISHTHTWHLPPSQLSSSRFSAGHAPLSAPHSGGTMIPPTSVLGVPGPVLVLYTGQNQGDERRSHVCSEQSTGDCHLP